MAAPAEALLAPGERLYVRRRPDRSVLHRVLRRHLNTFLAEREARELSIPHRLRFLLAFDHDLSLAVHRVYWRALRTFHRKRARRLGLVPEGAEIEAGAFTVIQRFGSSCELNLHFHTPMLDGVYLRTPRDAESWRLRSRGR